MTYFHLSTTHNTVRTHLCHTTFLYAFRWDSCKREPYIYWLFYSRKYTSITQCRRNVSLSRFLDVHPNQLKMHVSSSTCKHTSPEERRPNEMFSCTHRSLETTLRPHELLNRFTHFTCSGICTGPYDTLLMYRLEIKVDVDTPKQGLVYYWSRMLE